MESLKEKTAKGLFWGGLNSTMQQIIGLAFGILLGRLLSPSDYGMMAMISIFSLIATTLQSSGFPTALANIQNPKDEDYNSVFWFNILIGISAYLILFFCAPLIGDYYHTEKIVPLCRYAFLSIVFASFGTAQNAYLFKNLKAKQQAKSGIFAVFISSMVGAICAFNGLAYWSLATQGLIFVLFNTIMAWHYSSWRPSIHHITFQPVRKMFRFSCKMLASSITTNINNNILNIMLGHYFSPHDTGNYNQAYQWDSKCFSLVQGMVNQVAQPVLVNLRSEGDKQIQAFRKMMRFTAFISFPLLFGFGLVAKEFIVIALTAKWLVSAEFIQILCISGATMPIFSLLSNMVISKGKSGIYFWCTFGLGVVQIIVMLLTWPLGIRAMVIAYTILNVGWLFVWQYFVKRLAGYHLSMFFRDTLPFALAAFGVMAATHFTTLAIHNLILLLICRVFMAVILYYLVMKVAKVKILNECQKFILSKFKKS
ncbi:MAG TPA: flippase [Prevotella sp.]|nr:flippase [Prevotella sp.]